MRLGIGRVTGKGRRCSEEVEESEEVSVQLLGVVLRLIQGKCCLGVSLTLFLYSLPLTRKYLKGSGKCDFDKKPSYCSKECQKLTGRTINPSVVPVRTVPSLMTGRGTRRAHLNLRAGRSSCRLRMRVGRGRL